MATISSMAKELGVSRALIYRRMHDANLGDLEMQKGIDGQLSADQEKKIRELFPDYPKVSEPKVEVDSIYPQIEEDVSAHLRGQLAQLREQMAALKIDLQEKDLELRKVTMELEVKTRQVEQLRADVDAQRQLLQYNAVSLANMSQTIRAALPEPVYTEPEQGTEPEPVQEPEPTYTEPEPKPVQEPEQMPDETNRSSVEPDLSADAEADAEYSDMSEPEPAKTRNPFKRILRAFKGL